MEVTYIINGWTLDDVTCTATKEEQCRKLSQRELALLIYLCQRRGEVVGHQEYPDQCWPSQEVSQQVVNNMVSKLRKVLDLPGQTGLESIRNVGYRLACQVVKAQVARTNELNQSQPLSPRESGNELPSSTQQVRQRRKKRYVLSAVVLLLVTLLVSTQMRFMTVVSQGVIESHVQNPDGSTLHALHATQLDNSWLDQFIRFPDYPHLGVYCHSLLIKVPLVPWLIAVNQPCHLAHASLEPKLVDEQWLTANAYLNQRDYLTLYHLQPHQEGVRVSSFDANQAQVYYQQQHGNLIHFLFR